MPTVGEVYRRYRPAFGCVPMASWDFVCAECLGPVNEGFDRCYACEQLFVSWNGATRLSGQVVPMTTALNPSHWYRFLLTYKRGLSEHEVALGALTAVYLDQHRSAISSLLGGSPTSISVVPSKRGISYEEQPLRRALARVEGLRPQIRHLLRHTGQSVARRAYVPRAFEPVSPLADERVLLIEDTWVTGATALSAAGALLDHGAVAVVILPIARDIDSGFWGQAHPYRRFLKERVRAYDLSWWPR